MGANRGGFTRGQFLKVAAGVAAGVLFSHDAAAEPPSRLGPGIAYPSPGRFGLVHNFTSRPDLHPPNASVRPGTAWGRGGQVGLWFLSVVSTVPPGRGGEPGLLILDGLGEPVWFKVLPQGRTAVNLRVQTYRGQPVLTWYEGTGSLGEGVIMDSSYREIARVKAGNGRQVNPHEFLLTPQGTALITASPSIVSADLTSVGGSKSGRVADSVIQEIEIQTGQVLLEWRALEHVPVSESYMWPGNGVYDYMHANSIDVTPDGNLLVSGRHTWALYKLERQSGRVLWRLGGKKSDFKMGHGTQFAWQHDGRQVDEKTVTVFDDGAAFFAGNHHFRTTHAQSRGLALSVDDAARTVTLGRSYRHHPPLSTGGYGSMQTLGDGNLVIGWGNLPEFSEFTAGGRLVGELDLPVGYASYRVYRKPWQGTPTERPALAVTRRRGGLGATVYASWNGSTEYSAWRVRAGAHPSALQTLIAHRRTGFETAIDIALGGGYVEVTALDSSGRALARSPQVKL
jgi:hypothetical protein